MNCAVIFGGAGFIGVFYADLLLTSGRFDKVYLYDLDNVRAKGYKVRVDLLAKHGQKVVEVQGDVRKEITWQPAESVGLIANFAAVHREPGHEDFEYYDTNIKGAENVCAWAEKVNCQDIVFTSSISPYGVYESSKDETSLTVPNTAYGGSKLVAEKIHQIWRARQAASNGGDRRLLIVRPGVVFGPSEGGNVSRMVKAVKKGYFFYAGNKDVRKAGIYVKELCLSIEWVRLQRLQAEGGLALFNGSFSPCPSLAEYTSAVCTVAGWRRFIPTVPFWSLLLAAYFFEFAFSLIGRANNFSPVRIRKLVRANDVRPSYLLNHGYVYAYDVVAAFRDWKAQDPELWT